MLRSSNCLCNNFGRINFYFLKRKDNLCQFIKITRNIFNVQLLNFSLSDFKIEPWFGSHYSVDDIAPSLMDLWRDPPEIDASLHLPAKNEFIPCDFSIRASKVCNDLLLESSPRCILDEPLMKFWYKLDNSFKLPRANTYFRINLSGGYSSVKNCLLTELFVHLLKDKLNEIIYQVNN